MCEVILYLLITFKWLGIRVNCNSVMNSGPHVLSLRKDLRCHVYLRGDRSSGGRAAVYQPYGW